MWSISACVCSLSAHMHSCISASHFVFFTQSPASRVHHNGSSLKCSLSACVSSPQRCASADPANTLFTYHIPLFTSSTNSRFSSYRKRIELRIRGINSLMLQLIFGCRMLSVGLSQGFRSVCEHKDKYVAVCVGWVVNGLLSLSDSRRSQRAYRRLFLGKWHADDTQICTQLLLCRLQGDSGSRKSPRIWSRSSKQSPDATLSNPPNVVFKV